MRAPTWSPTPLHRDDMAFVLELGTYSNPLERMLWRVFHVDHDTFAWRR